MMGMEIIVCAVLLLVGIAVLVIIHVCIVSRAFGSNTHSNGGVNVNVVQRSMNRISSMSQGDIKKLPSFHYTAEETDVSSGGGGGGSSNHSPLEMECAVCLENFMVGEECRMLPKCKHCFHAECIDSWLLKTAVCPICRTEAISPTPEGHDKNQIEAGVGVGVGFELV